METLVTFIVSLVLRPMGEIEIKERIKQQAHDLIMQYGIRSVSMDDIANSLGMSKKTIYQYFADKDELIEGVVDDVIKRNEKLCLNDCMNAENAVHEIMLAKEFTTEMLKAMNPSVMFDMQKYHPGAFIKFQRHRTEFLFNIIRANILRGINEDFYRNDLRTELVARLRVESLLIPFSPEFQAGIKYTLAEVQEELIELYLYSLVNAKGHKMISKYKQEREKKIQNNAKTK